MLSKEQANPELGRPHCEKIRFSSHAADGKAQTAEALKMRPKPTNLLNHRMNSMSDGEISRVLTNDIPKTRAGFKTQRNDADRWRIAYVRHLRKAQSHSENHG
jgi:hypothetical protein